MASQLLPDELWNEIEPLFPQYEPSPEGGCPPKEARKVLKAILFVLKTGIGWKDLPTEAFGCSYKTCLRRIQEWSRLGLWQQMHELLLAKLRQPHPGRLVQGAGRLQPGEGPAGRAKTGPNPTDRGRSGGKHCLLTDAEGVPLVVQTAAANEHDSTTLLPLVIDLPHVAGRVGRPNASRLAGG